MEQPERLGTVGQNRRMLNRPPNPGPAAAGADTGCAVLFHKRSIPARTTSLERSTYMGDRLQKSVEYFQGADAPRTRKRITILGALIALLMIQGLYAFATEPEPYPAIRLPGFGAAPTPDGKFANEGLEITIRYADGTALRPSPDSLASDVRFSSARTTLDRAFRPLQNGTRNPNADKPEVISWLKRQASALNPSSPKEAEFCWRTRVVEIRDGSFEYVGDCKKLVVPL